MRPLRTPLLLGMAGLALWAGTPAHADGASARGAQGQTLTVSAADGVSPGGATLTVTGRGYDVRKGIYVAFCRDNGPGKPPSPCGGGADTTGSGGGSHWVSSNPPPYGRGLATPYGPDGSFRVTIRISARPSGAMDCMKVRCVVATRADHTRSTDRTQDVRVPISFDDGGVPVALVAGGAAVAAVLAAGGVVTVRRSRATGRGSA
ncbi:hypothetical protein DPM19_03220 [Actinomadura craniellae]|uniref:Uncharacterized protein n=1 Tax=Actinomadura craniellae TaxID=2231787 RepID=A0A365HDJ1_9ACTN|nr:hypothetical protein [Actinomadura craniellae]RAY17175.1 hypothetical protein DPM19_03220 [Actinomadura craniellae]